MNHQPMSIVERAAMQIDLNGKLPSKPDIGVSQSDAVILSRTEAHAPAQSPAVCHGFGPYVELDFQALQNSGFLTPESERSLLAEEYRVIKRPIVRAAIDFQKVAGGRDNAVLVTSSRPEEGKTFTAINLAMSIAAEHDFHVLLIDGDMRRRGMSKAFGLSERTGLMDVLDGGAVSLPDAILRTNVPRLSILPAGRSAAAPTEILASEKMRNIVSDITHRYRDRFIIFDSPPVLAASEPGVLAGYVGQVIMVVRANETTKQAVAESLDLIESCSNVNFVLNSATSSARRDRFGYYGNYGEN
jgi:receptor protein-tyrosine kinase